LSPDSSWVILQNLVRATGTCCSGGRGTLAWSSRGGYSLVSRPEIHRETLYS